ncbi:MAG: hypothetical protein HQL69_02730 [Magnetococcales bacterium]|nr:hypothetical protein [Magnetococcales bacterium]
MKQNSIYMTFCMLMIVTIIYFASKPVVSVHKPDETVPIIGYALKSSLICEQDVGNR